MVNKNVYLTIGIIVILVCSIGAYIAYSGLAPAEPSASPTPSPSPSPSPTASVSSSPSPTVSASPTPTVSSSPSPSGSTSSETAAITVSSSPAGSGYVKVDGTVVTTPNTFTWAVGSTHALEAVTSIAGSSGTQYVWTGWSDSGARVHTYVVSSSSALVTANYKTQYQLTFAQSGLDSSADGPVVTTNVGGASSDMPFTLWVDAGTQVTYSYQSNVSTSVTNALFMLSSTPSSGSITATGPATVSGTYGRAIIDAAGNLIHLPPASQINRIADSWPAHNTIVVMVGAKDKLVATYPINTVNPMFQKILPAIETMIAPFNTDGTVNIEELLAVNPDIVFVSSSNEAPAAAMESSGLLVVRLNFFNFEDMTKCVQMTGWILGEDALDRANEYVSYFNGVSDNITAITSQISTEEKPLVMHLVGTNPTPIRVDAGGGLVNTWINLCGGNNAAGEVSGNVQTVSLEQVLAWNPEIVLIGSAQANDIKDYILNDAAWSEVAAVKDGKVLANPMGVFDWSRYSVEEALNIQWVAKTLHPDLFANIDIRAETLYFYQTFYEYTLSNAELDAILNNTPLP